MIIGDVLVLAVTWTKTAQAYLEARRLQIKAPLATMLLRDGMVFHSDLVSLFHLLIVIFLGTVYFMYVFVVQACIITNCIEIALQHPSTGQCP